MKRLTNCNKEMPSLTKENLEYWLQTYFKLKEYEDLEEQGRLIKLPCKVGDGVWILYSDGKIEWLIVESIEVGELCDIIKFDNGSWFSIWDKDYTLFNKHIFKTKEEAEKALAEMECE